MGGPKVDGLWTVWDRTRDRLQKAVKKVKHIRKNQEVIFQTIADIFDKILLPVDSKKELKIIKEILDKRAATAKREGKQWDSFDQRRVFKEIFHERNTAHKQLLAGIEKGLDQLKLGHDAEICACEELKTHQEAELNVRLELYDAIFGHLIDYQICSPESVLKNQNWAIDYIEKVCPKHNVELAKAGNLIAIEMKEIVEKCPNPHASWKESVGDGSSAPDADDNPENEDVPRESDEPGPAGEDRADQEEAGPPDSE